ncbi:MAG: response regulator [Treponema sp.]|nr:response regulator [Treponema sp.]
MAEEKIKLVIADDSAIIRGILEKAFTLNGNFEIVGSVSNGRKAIGIVEQTIVDIVVSDIDMPEMNGIEATKIITEQHNVPVIIFSEDKSLKTDAVSAGATFFEEKPPLSAVKIENLSGFVERVRTSVKKIKPKPGSQKNNSPNSRNFKVLVLGASTGGPTAVQEFLLGLGSQFNLPIVYVQHIDIGADQKMVNWFNSSCPNISVHLASDGQEAKPGNVYMAPADRHLVIDFVRSNGNPILKLTDEPEERFLRPAVNKLFRSAAKNYGENCLALLMTGMGQDGAEGCKMIVENGGYTIAESKETCAVFGMPAAAIEMNAATEVLPRDKIANRVKTLTGSI